jgi:hypothetical protein
MLIPHVVQTEADKVFINIYNSQAAAVTDGDLVAWNTSSPDGVKTTQPITATLSLLCGVVDGTIAAAAYGLAQAYGYRATCLVTGDPTTAIAAGDILIPDATVGTDPDYAGWSVASNGTSGFLFAAEVVASSAAAAAVKVFIKCM